MDAVQGCAIGDELTPSKAATEMLGWLERLLPSYLAAVSSFWEGESLDGFRFAVATRTGPARIQLVGQALLISDQTWIPIALDIAAKRDGGDLAYLQCEIGEDGSDGLIRLPFDSDAAAKACAALPPRLDTIDWRWRIEVREP